MIKSKSTFSLFNFVWLERFAELIHLHVSSSQNFHFIFPRRALHSRLLTCHIFKLARMMFHLSLLFFTTFGCYISSAAKVVIVSTFAALAQHIALSSILILFRNASCRSLGRLSARRGCLPAPFIVVRLLWAERSAREAEREPFREHFWTCILHTTFTTTQPRN